MNRVEAIEFAKEQQEIFGGRMGEFLKFVEDELAQLPTAPRWIPVTERLPESKDERVLVCGERGGITIARYFANHDYGGGFQHTFWVQGNKTMKVTAWMPLPEPPKGE